MPKILLANDTSTSHHYGCDLVMKALVKLLQNVGLEIAGTIPVGHDWRKHSGTMLRRGEVSAIIVNGEGSIHHSETRSRARFLPQLATYAEDELEIPAFLVNSTVYEVADSVLEDIARFDRCFVRDSASFELLARAGTRSSIVPDLSISNELPVLQERSGTLVTDSVLRDQRDFLRGYAQRNAFEFLPMGRVHYDDEVSPPSLEGFVRKIASSRLVITGRYHVACLCLATKTPFVALESNSPKTSFICLDVLGSCRRIWSRSQIDDSDFGGYSEWNASERRNLSLLRIRARHGAELMAAHIRDRIVARSK